MKTLEKAMWFFIGWTVVCVLMLIASKTGIIVPDTKYFSVICQQDANGVAMCEQREGKDDYDFVIKSFGLNP